MMGEAVGAHRVFLMGENAEVAAGHGAAEKDEAGDLVLGEAGAGMVVLDAAFDSLKSSSLLISRTGISLRAKNLQKTN